MVKLSKVEFDTWKADASFYFYGRGAVNWPVDQSLIFNIKFQCLNQSHCRDIITAVRCSDLFPLLTIPRYNQS